MFDLHVVQSTGFYTIVDFVNLLLGVTYDYGFGYDSLSDDYKIVVAGFTTPGDGAVVWVYSLNNNTWTSVDDTPPPPTTAFGNAATAILIDGHLLHWRCWDQSTGEHGIHCFDVCSERWANNIPLPDYSDNAGSSTKHFADILFNYHIDNRDDVVHLGVLDGRLCLVTRNHQQSEHNNIVDVWVMKEYGVKESWIKLLGISDSHATESLRIVPLAYGRGSRSEILLRRIGRPPSFVWYNVKDRRYRRAVTDMDHVNGCWNGHGACVFKGSLVTICRGKRITKENRTNNSSE